MFSKNSRSERSFSIMLAEELLRAELKKLYGDKIKFFQSDIVATPLSPVKLNNTSVSDIEKKSMSEGFFDGSQKVNDRQVNIKAIIGSFERLYPSNPMDDRRHKLCRVKAACRVFSLQTGSVQYQAHFLKFVVTNEHGLVVNTEERIYETGCVDGKESAKNSENPCRDMIDSQTAVNYPTIHRELHGVA